MYTRTNLGWEGPRLTNVKIPQNAQEFSKMGYSQRVWLLEQHPTIYQKFAHPKQR